MTSRLGRLERMASGETDTVECKSELDFATREGKATLVSRCIGLANAYSGSTFVVLGVDDNGNPTGQDHSGLTDERLHQIVHDLCEPYVSTTATHLRVDGRPVCVIEISPRREDLPYRARRTVGNPPILEQGTIYYRYGRHTLPARYAEINRLMRSPRPRGRNAPDDYTYMSPEQRKEAMERDLKAAFHVNGFTARDKQYQLFFEFEGGRVWPRRTYPTVDMTVGRRDIRVLIDVEPVVLRANFLTRRPMRGMALQRPAGKEQLQLLVAHGSVGQPLSPPWRRTIMQRLDFGWYVGPTPESHSEMDGVLMFENARTKSGMGQIVASLIEWLEGPGQDIMLLTDRPGGQREDIQHG